MTLPVAEFKKIELRVAKILDAQEIPGADRIWKLIVDVGDAKKEIVAGIKAFYSKEALVGRNVVIVNNLDPAVIRGVTSSGMLLAAKHGDRLTILSVEQDLPPGSVVG